MKTVKIGFVGCGAISGIYLENITKRFKEIEIIGVCDLIRERAENAVKKYNIPKLYDTMHELFADPEIDIVLNLTRPYQHYEVSKAALLAGKHVYSEKPLGADLEEGIELVKLAEEKGLVIGGAPDTFLGAGIQTCRRLIDSGVIGDIIGGRAVMACHGHETWHPDPDFYYQRGGGPLFDMGPYYITALTNLIGGISIASQNHDMVGACLEALSAETYRTVTPAWYETALKVKYSRDDLSSQMIDLIKESATSNFIYAFNYAINGMGLVYRDLVTKNNKDYASAVKRLEKSANQKLENVLDVFRGIEG